VLSHHGEGDFAGIGLLWLAVSLVTRAASARANGFSLPDAARYPRRVPTARTAATWPPA
jgi:hypothetical protein